MDNKTFDALTRRFGVQRNRRDAVKAFVGGLVGLGIARDAGAQVTAERALCGQQCDGRDDFCNAGMRCSKSSGTGSNGGICVRRRDTNTTCSRNTQCSDPSEVCRNEKCVNITTCTRCVDNVDCPAGRVCRNGNCGECTRDAQCPAREICRNGRCERDRNSCSRDRDCPRRRQCRNGRCVRRN